MPSLHLSACQLNCNYMPSACMLWAITHIRADNEELSSSSSMCRPTMHCRYKLVGKNVRGLRIERCQMVAHDPIHFQNSVGALWCREQEKYPSLKMSIAFRCWRNNGESMRNLNQIDCINSILCVWLKTFPFSFSFAFTFTFISRIQWRCAAC